MRRYYFLALLLLFCLCVSAQKTMTGGDGIGKMSYFTCPSKGEMRFPVVVVKYQDVGLLESDEDAVSHFEEFFNQKGYGSDLASGSVRDYFLAASAGKFAPYFDVLGVIKLKNDRKYYGAGAGTGAGHPEEMVIEAVDALKDKDIDFTKYDSNADGCVDDIIIVFAGNGEGYGTSTEAVLPTSFLISYDKYGIEGFEQGYAVGDVCFDSYTVIHETAYGKYDNLGIFIHEFSHALGLADAYNVYDTNANYTPYLYDVMDQGLYNNSRRTPPTFSAFERFALGWIDLEVIEKAGDYELAPLGESNTGYILSVSEKEFFIFENRQKQGWDTYLPYHGLLVWHIDYDETAWFNNQANYQKSHQRIDLVEASGKVGTTTAKQRGYPFPGTSNVTELTLMPWSGEPLPLTLSNIREENGKILFTVNNATAINSVEQMFDGFCICGRMISAPMGIKVYGLDGRQIGEGSEVCVPGAGIYLVRSAKGTARVLVK